jgi:hypothetical protein
MDGAAQHVKHGGECCAVITIAFQPKTGRGYARLSPTARRVLWLLLASRVRTALTPRLLNCKHAEAADYSDSGIVHQRLRSLR